MTRNNIKNRMIFLLLCISMVFGTVSGMTYGDEVTVTGAGVATDMETSASEEEEEEVLYDEPLPSAAYLTNKALTLGGDEAIAMAEPEVSEEVPKKEAPAEDPPIIKALKARLEARSIYDDIAIAQVSDYVNIRDAASENGKVLGKIYNNSAATILETVTSGGDKWFRIKSGKVEGYIKAQFFVTGEEAKQIAASVGYVNARIKVNSLRLRQSPDLGSATITVLAKDSVYAVESQGLEFSKISVDGDIVGYVQNDYIEIGINYKEAISIEEEQEKLRQAREAEEKARKLQEEEAKKKAQKTTTAGSSSKKTTAAPQDYGDTSAKREAIVAYALQYVGVLNYVLGGDSLVTGTDCSGFVQIIYRKFGVSLPRVSDEQGKCGRSVSSSEMRKGDLIYYGGHIGIYIGNGQVCHCSTAKTWPNTKISTWNYRTVKSIRNVLGD